MTMTVAEERAQALIAETIVVHTIVLFMKGTPLVPQCGFSAGVVEILRRHDVPFHSVNLLADPALRQGIKIYSDWPTIPQLYVNGTFVGGYDIVRELHETGELAGLFDRARVEA